MNFLKVLRGDIAAILRTKFLKIAVPAIALIPLIYGGLYLAAFWDPYGVTKNLPVAFVNLDKGGISDKKNVNYGKDVVDTLKYNHDLEWKFVSNEKDAEAGLKGDKYYAMIVVPKDFTQKLVNLNDKGSLIKPQLLYVSNKKKNYVVGLITDKVSKVLQTDVSSNVVGNFTEGIFDSMYELRDGMESASDGTGQIREGIQEVRDKIPSLADGVNKLYDGSTSLNSNLLDAKDGSNKLRDGTATLKDKMPDLEDGVNKLNDGSISLNKSISDALKGSNTIKDGVASLGDKMPTLSNGVNDLYDGSTQLKDGLNEVNSNMPDLVKGVSDLNYGAKQLNFGLISARDGSVNLGTGIAQVQAGILQMESSIVTSTATELGLPASAQSALPTQIQALASIYPGMVTVLNGINGTKLQPTLQPILQSGITTMSGSGCNDALNTLSTDITANTSSQYSADFFALGKILDSDYSSLSAVSTNLGTILPVLKTYPATICPPAFYNGISQIKSGIDNLVVLPNSLKSTLDLLQGTAQLAAGTSQLTVGAGSLTNGINQLYIGSNQLALGTGKLNDKTGDLADGMDTLYNGSRSLNTGVAEFKSDIPDLKNGINQLSGGTKDLSDGLFSINSGAGSLTDGIGKLKKKVPDLEDGVNQLNSGSVDLSDGILKLYNGSGDLKDGIGTLNSKIPDLQSGTEKLYDGTAQLNDALKDGASKLSDKLKVPSKGMSSFMTSPVDLKDKPLYDMKGYGEGMAPYFICLALWVGALMMFFIISQEAEDGIEANPAEVVLGKYLTFSGIGVVQAIILSIAVLKLGLKPSNITLFITFNVFLSFVFVAIMQNLVFMFDMPGRLIAIIVLLLQLTSSNGTFPKELVPSFFQKVGPFMPFTYAISALREINNGNIDYNILHKDIAILAFMLVGFLTASVLFKGHVDKIKRKIKLRNQQQQQALEA